MPAPAWLVAVPQWTREHPRRVDWGSTAVVVALAFMLRLINLGYPHKFLFDETYYAKEAAAQWKFGYSRNFIEGADALVLDGETKLAELTTETPNMVVHPELGKWLIGFGEQVFGFDPFGWRIMSVLAGCLMVWALIRIVRRLTGSILLGCLAGLLLSVDGLHFVLSRLGILDIFAAAFLTCAISCLLADQDWRKAPHSRGLLRPWRVAAGVFFGLGLAVKWSLLVPLAIFGVWVFARDLTRRRRAHHSAGGDRRWLAKGIVVDGVPAFLSLVGVAAATYLVGWVGFLTHAETFEANLSNSGYGEPWGDYYTSPAPGGALGELGQDLRSLANYHQAVYDFHANELDDATHPYQSSPLGWPLLNRPVGVDVELDIRPGDQGCQAPSDSTCLRQITMLGTPVLWWGGALALLACAVLWGWERNWRYGFPVIGYLAMWLPWFRYDDRPIFSYYAVTMLPFAIMALCLVASRLLAWATREHHGATSGYTGASRDGNGVASGPRSGRRLAVAVGIGTFAVATIVNFAYFLPIYTDGLLTHEAWLDRMWFERWI